VPPALGSLPWILSTIDDITETVPLPVLEKPSTSRGRTRMRTYLREYADIDGCRTALWDTGPGTGPTLVFVHGIGGAKTVWSPVLELLPPEWRLIAYDYRGGGETEEDKPARLSVARWVSDLETLIGARGVEAPVVLVGHSLGATIVLQFALDRPSVPSAIVLVGAEAALCRLGPVMLERARAIEETGVDGWVRGPWRAAPPFSNRTQAERPELIDEYSKMLYLTGAERYVRAVTAIADSPDLSGSIGAIGVPALVLIGGEDDRTTPEVGWQLAGALPNGRGVELADVGHTLSYEAPRQVAEEITAFVREHGLG
jgi:pimeloyl-ACP methyl ester carboxylesterase